jgi:gamma-glutamyltranspeptidase/glutathione hydrolase
LLKLSRFIKEQGGFLSYEDLANHHSEWVDPVSTNYRGMMMWELPPNGQGWQRYKCLMKGMILVTFHLVVQNIYTLSTKLKNGFEDRAKYYADMNFVKVPVQQLLSKEYGDKRRALIDLDKSEHIKLVKSVIQDRIYDRC